MISEFYAVTLTSVYHVMEKGEHNNPSAKKVALKGRSALQVGHTLENGPGRLIAIRKGLLAFIPEGGGYTSFEREPAKVNTRWHEWNSSFIVALFLTCEEATACFNEGSLQPADERWLDSTRTVLEEIGDNHPAFVISHWHGDCLLPELAVS